MLSCKSSCQTDIHKRTTLVEALILHWILQPKERTSVSIMNSAPVAAGDLGKADLPITSLAINGYRQLGRASPLGIMRGASHLPAKKAEAERK